MSVLLTRVQQNKDGTYGVLSLNGQPQCVTLEDPWNDNKRNISCIPAGKYKCKKHYGMKYRNVWILEDVPGRSAILIHAGNTIEDTQGCILVGNSFTVFGDATGIGNSQIALNKLREVLPDEFVIEIKDCF